MWLRLTHHIIVCGGVLTLLLYGERLWGAFTVQKCLCCDGGAPMWSLSLQTLWHCLSTEMTLLTPVQIYILMKSWHTVNSCGLVCYFLLPDCLLLLLVDLKGQLRESDVTPTSISLSGSAFTDWVDGRQMDRCGTEIGEGLRRRSGQGFPSLFFFHLVILSGLNWP